MQKFKRNYRCEFIIGKQDLSGNKTPQYQTTIEFPITVQFSISRNANSDCNTANFKFFNIRKENQNLLWKDFYQQDKYIEMKMYAGYGENMPLVFQGLVQQCITYRPSGATEVITEIQANDQSYLFQYGYTNATLSKDTEPVDVFTALMTKVPDIQVGFLSPELRPLKKATTYVGQPMDLLIRDYSQYQMFVDLGNLHVLGDREVIPNTENYVITANSGLLGSPIRSAYTIELDMLFEPGIIVGQAVKLLSDMTEELNGTYKVLAMEHAGTISPVVCDKLTTHLSLVVAEGFKEAEKPTKYDDIKVSGKGWIKPVNYAITSPYGEPRTGPKPHTHGGLDYGCPMNTPVKASQDGIVQVASLNVSGFGRCIYLNHGKIGGNNVVSIYGHLNTLQVSQNQKVTKGQVIGYSGSTGYSSGAHLHFEIRENNRAVNPNKYIGN